MGRYHSNLKYHTMRINFLGSLCIYLSIRLYAKTHDFINFNNLLTQPDTQTNKAMKNVLLLLAQDVLQ